MTNEELKKELKKLEGQEIFTKEDIAELERKAAKWDALAAQMDKFYKDDSDADLGDILQWICIGLCSIWMLLWVVDGQNHPHHVVISSIYGAASLIIASIGKK